jgi:hypothetical protein
VAKRLANPYTWDTVWRKIRNGGYTQMAGRGGTHRESTLFRAERLRLQISLASIGPGKQSGLVFSRNPNPSLT